MADRGFDLSTARPIQDESDGAFDLSTARPVTRPTNRIRSFAESPTSRLLFPGIGQALGTVAGTTLGSSAGGVGAVPGGLTGAVTGRGAGEALREFLARLGGGGEPSTPRAFQRVAEESALGAVGEAAGSALRTVGRTIAMATPPTVARVGQLISRVPSDAIRRAIGRGPKRVLDPRLITPELQQETIDKVTNGLNAFREQSEKAYQQALKDLKPTYVDKKVNLGQVTQRFRQRLLEAKVVDESGRPLKPLLPEATEVSRTHRQLVNILKRFGRLPARRGARGGFLPVEEALTLKRELDTLLDFDPNAIREISKEGQRLLKGLRVSLKEGIDEIVPELKPINDEYHTFRELYDAVQPMLKDRNIEGTIRRILTGTNRFTFKTLSKINTRLDPEFQFLNEALDDLAAIAFSKEPELFAVLPLQMAGAVGGFMKAGPLGAMGGLFLGAQASSGRSLAAALRGAESVGQATRPVARLTSRLIAPTRPFQGTAASSLFRDGGNEESQTIP